MVRTGDDIIDSINYNKELFAFLKKIFPNISSCKECREKLNYYSKENNVNRKIKASIIICPICNYYCVEDMDPVLDIFKRHIKMVHKASLSNELLANLKATISYLREHDKIPYIDPFIHVPRDALHSK
jgi:hypothetical protein